MDKAIVCINGSRNIKHLNLNYFIYPEHVECVLEGGASGVDTIAQKWADEHEIERITFYPQWAVYGKRAGIVRNCAMVDICDVLISFWDGKSLGTKQTIEYAIKTGKPYICHLIQELD